jgi:hypothetical protein
MASVSARSFASAAALSPGLGKPSTCARLMKFSGVRSSVAAFSSSARASSRLPSSASASP